MKASNLSVLILLAGAVAACSSTGDEQKNKQFYYKAAAVKVRPLEVPPELTAPAGNDRYGIPGSNEDGVRFSDFSKGGTNAGSDVLPEIRNVRLVRSGDQRWLEVNDKAENIWPLVKAFWQENGLPIKIDNPQAGIIETEWAENRAKVPNVGVRKLLGGVFDSLYSSGERDQYHTRLERSKDGKATEITIKHSGLQEVLDPAQTGYKWLSRPADPELEATMLQLLMAKLAGGATLAAGVQQSAATAAPVAVKLQTRADGSKSILLSEPFDKSWRQVSQALEQAGIALEDKDRSKGLFFLRAAKNSSGKSDAYQVSVRETGAGCEVTSSTAKGASSADTQRVIDALYQQLGKQ